MYLGDMFSCNILHGGHKKPKLTNAPIGCKFVKVSTILLTDGFEK